MLIGINGGYFPAICRVCLAISTICRHARRVGFSTVFTDQLHWFQNVLILFCLSMLRKTFGFQVTNDRVNYQQWFDFPGTKFCVVKRVFGLRNFFTSDMSFFLFTMAPSNFTIFPPFIVEEFAFAGVRHFLAFYMYCLKFATKGVH